MSEQSTESPEQTELTRKDYTSDQMVRWCPGCGDYAILSSVQGIMPKLGHKKEDFVFVSGIGCAARFPYYMNTYGFHSIHGRAPAIATGVKLGNPDLIVWEITGDGDSLAIGGNHFIHVIRRNVDINILLFNNEIYGLTKGQYSPTSKKGIVTKSTPMGSVEEPFSAGELALGANGKFFARTYDSPKVMGNIFEHAAKYNGTALIEILQNCLIFNDKTHDHVLGKDVADNNQVHLVHGEPMLFGKDKEKGIVLDGIKLKAVTIGEDGVTESDILVHDAHDEDSTLHYMLIRMSPDDGLPVAFGIIREVFAKTYNDHMADQREIAKKKAKVHNMDELLQSGNTWVVD